MNNASPWINLKSWQEVENLQKAGQEVVLIPVGSTEQHGLHLPLGTDTMIAMKIAEDAAKKTESLVVPPLYFGWSPHHLALCGSISIRAEILTELLYDIFSSLAEHNFKKFIVVNGHRIVNIPWVQIACERAQRQLEVKTLLFDPAYASKSLSAKFDFPEIGHAEDIETSQMLYLYPQEVDMSKAVDFKLQQALPYSVDPAFSGDTLCYIPSVKKTLAEDAAKSYGVTGEATKASKERGKQYHKHLIAFLVEVINILKKQ